nr:putative glycosyl hydrolase [synthetic construct]
MSRILVNHIGYERLGPKKSVIDAPEQDALSTFELKDSNHRVCYTGKVERSGTVDGWKGYYFWSLDFSDFTKAGQYYIEVKSENDSAVSGVFAIRDQLLEWNAIPDVLSYFSTQHCAGRYDRFSRSLPVEGTDKRADVHGGWYDASGDKGQYLTHLSHSIYLNPQQTPMVVWNFLNIAALLEKETDDARRLLYYSLVDEAAYGGDFLVRLMSPDGYFYMGIRNVDYNDPAKRLVAGVMGDESLLVSAKNENSIKSGFREGAGVAIAALARLSTITTYGDYDSATYLDIAVRAFQHLQKHNTEYLYDQKENIVDDYCALLAAVELYAATGKETFYSCAEARLKSLQSRQANKEYPGHFDADDEGKRPFYHPADAGLPAIALLRFCDIAKTDEAKESALRCVRAYLTFALNITNEVNNPFGYARQLVKAVDAPVRSSFFMPHHNETGYWWQGENATLASQSAMAFLAVKYFQDDKEFCRQLIRYGMDQLNWILGLNPFDSCMLHGKGHDNRNYYDPLPLVCGGICNRVTGGFDDEADIAFDTEGLRDRPDTAWRWTEQWIPHGAWFVLAAGLYSFGLEKEASSVDKLAAALEHHHHHH